MGSFVTIKFMKDILFRKVGSRGLFLISFIFCIFLLLKFPWEMGAVFRYGFGLVILYSFIILFFTYSQQNLVYAILGLFAIFALYGYTLLSLWKNGLGEMQVLGGTIFFSDTFLFFSESNSLLDGGSFYLISARRPLFSSFFSSLLLFTGRNLQLSLLLLVTLNAVAIYLVSIEIKKTDGILAATTASMLFFLFYRRFIGTPDTENYGVVFGIVGFSLLWNPETKNRLPQNLFGLFLITLGLLGRAGPFLVLAGVLIWLVTNQEAGKRKILVMALSILVILTGFLLNYFISKAVNKAPGMLFTNYSQTIYGISVGGKGWEQAYKDFPELKSIPEKESSKELYQLALMKMRANPFLTLKGVIWSWFDFFSLKDESVFGFASGGELIFRNILNTKNSKWYVVWRLFLYCLSLAGITWCWKNRDKPRYRLILFCLLGIFLSIPFLPPRDSALMRVYAGSVTPIILVPAIGFSYLFSVASKTEILYIQKPHHRDISRSVLVGFGIFLVLTTLLVPVMGRQGMKLPDLSNRECSNGLTSAVVRVIPGSVVNIVADDSSTSIMPISITRTMFINSIDDFPKKEYIESLRQLIAPVAIANVFDIQTRAYFWMVTHRNFFVNTPQLLWVCGAWSKEMLANGLRFFETNDFYILAQ